MEDEQSQENSEQELTRVGEPLVVWEIDEYPRQVRSRRWYTVAGLGGLALIIYALATANFLFAVIILMFGVITLVADFKTPDRLTVGVTSTGLLVGDTYYDFRSVKDFSILYEPPDVKVLYIDFQSAWEPLLTIPLEDTDPNAIRECLLPFCAENLERTDISLTERLQKRYKL